MAAWRGRDRRDWLDDEGKSGVLDLVGGDVEMEEGGDEERKLEEG